MSDPQMRIDDLAQRAGVASTTVRLYQTKGLLPPPYLVGRVGFYDDAHLARLRLIGRLQERGYSLAAIGDLLATWQQGRDLDAVLGVEAQLDELLNGRTEIVLTIEELLARFPGAELGPEEVRRAVELGLVELLADGRVRVPDIRFLDTGAALVALGISAGSVLEEWAQLVAHTDDIAARFVGVFEREVLADDWRAHLDGDAVGELASALHKLRKTAHDVVAAALDASIARAGTDRLAELMPDATSADEERTA